MRRWLLKIRKEEALADVSSKSKGMRADGKEARGCQLNQTVFVKITAKNCGCKDCCARTGCKKDAYVYVGV
jgi:hypothetical protein